jgi:hypothetical protein
LGSDGCKVLFLCTGNSLETLRRYGYDAAGLRSKSSLDWGTLRSRIERLAEADEPRPESG